MKSQKAQELLALLKSEMGRKDPGSDSYAPLSAAQLGVFISQQLDPSNPYHNGFFAVRLSGPLDIERLRESLVRLSERHEVLRTSVHEVNGDLVQHISDSAPVEMQSSSVEALPGEIRLSTAIRQAEADIRRPFKLTELPLARVLVIRLAASDHILALTAHHFAADGWGIRVLVRELAAAYNQKPLPGLTKQYRSFADWQSRWLSGEEARRQFDFWQKKLEQPIPRLILAQPGDHEGSIATSGSRKYFALPAALSQSIKSFSSSAGVTPFICLLSAYQVLLARSFGQPKFRIGTSVSLRPEAAFENLVGSFTNTLVFDLNPGEGVPFRGLVEQTRETVLEAFENQEYPFTHLIEKLNPNRGPGAFPWFQAGFLLHNTRSEEDFALEGMESFPLQLDTGRSRLELQLTMSSGHDGFLGYFEYRGAYFDGKMMDRFTAAFMEVLSELLDAPDQPVSLLQGEPFQPGEPAKINQGDNAENDVFAQPTTEIEQKIASIWKEIFDIKEIGLHQDFLVLGGDSMRVMALVSRINHVFDIEIPTSVFFDAVTVYEQAQVVEKMLG